MRFTLIKDINKDSAMRPIMNGLLLFTLIYLPSDLFVTDSMFGLFYEAIKTTLYGNTNEFIDPIGKSIFLEYIHTQIFFMMMILLTLSAIFARLASTTKYYIFIINIAMISALLSLISLGLSYFFSKIFIDIYIINYFAWHLSSLYMTLYSLWALNYAKSI